MKLEHKNHDLWPDVVPGPVQAILYRAARQPLKNINHMLPLSSESLGGFHGIQDQIGILLFWNRVLLCSHSWVETQCADRADFQLRDLPVLA